MWLQVRLYLLVGLMFAILYGILVGIGYYLQITGLYFYLFIIGIAAGFVLLQFMIGPKIVEWSMRIKYVSEQEYPKLHQMVAELSQIKQDCQTNQGLGFHNYRSLMHLRLDGRRKDHVSASPKDFWSC